MFRWFVNKNSSRRRRRLAVVAHYSSLACILAWIAVDRRTDFSGFLVSMIAAVLSMSIFAALRASVQNLADAGTEQLDERQQKVRNNAYRLAYRVLSTVVMLVLLYVLFAFEPGIRLCLPETSGFFCVYFPFFWLSFTLPTAIIDWNEPDSETDE